MYLLIVDRVDSLEDRQKTFFSNCAKNKLKGSEKDEYESIRKEYQKVKSFICSKKIVWVKQINCQLDEKMT